MPRVAQTIRRRTLCVARKLFLSECGVSPLCRPMFRGERLARWALWRHAHAVRFHETLSVIQSTANARKSVTNKREREFALLRLGFGAGQLAAKHAHFIAIHARKIANSATISTCSFFASTVRFPQGCRAIFGKCRIGSGEFCMRLFKNNCGEATADSSAPSQRLTVRMTKVAGGKSPKVSLLFFNCAYSPLVTVLLSRMFFDRVRPLLVTRLP